MNKIILFLLVFAFLGNQSSFAWGHGGHGHHSSTSKHGYHHKKN